MSDVTYRKYLNIKLHGLTVTDAHLYYEGSITIPKDILDTSGLKVHEAIHVWNVTRGTRFETYILEGNVGSQEIAINGAAAHLAGKGDKIIAATFAWIPTSQASHAPIVLFFDDKNVVKEVRAEKLPENLKK